LAFRRFLLRAQCFDPSIGMPRYAMYAFPVYRYHLLLCWGPIDVAPDQSFPNQDESALHGVLLSEEEHHADEDVSAVLMPDGGAKMMRPRCSRSSPIEPSPGSSPEVEGGSHPEMPRKRRAWGRRGRGDPLPAREAVHR
jgi:hypothetical protein